MAQGIVLDMNQIVPLGVVVAGSYVLNVFGFKTAVNNLLGIKEVGAPITCPTGQHLVGTVCVPDTITCPTGQHLVGTTCVPDTITCPTGTHLVGTTCVPDVTGGFVDNFDTAPYVLNIGQTSPNGIWRCVYIGQGVVQQTGGIFSMQPKTATGTVDSSGVGYETYAPEAMTTGIFSDVQIDFDMRTVRQLRQNLPPNPWEVGWIFFRFTDESPKSNHHYYFIMKPTGCEFGKKDNAPGDTGLEQQIYLPTVGSKNLVFGQWNHYSITLQGWHIIIKVDGQTIVNYTDTPNDPAKMAAGHICLYNEDAQVEYDHFVVTPI